MFNGLAINPAYAGVYDFIGLTGNVREQWVGIEGAPSTQTFSGFAPIFNNQFGLGVNILNDKIGARSQQEVNFNYAYKLRFPGYNVSLGLKLGFNAMNNEFDELFLDEVDDINFYANNLEIKPSVGLGAFLKANKYYVGLSIPQLYQFIISDEYEYNLEKHRLIFLTGGFIYQIDQNFKVRPSFLAKTHLGGVFEMDLNANLYYKDDYCIGLSYKSLNALAVILEIGFNKTYYIGYSYDIATSKLFWQQSGTHEFSLNVYLNRNDNSKVVNPRYF